MPRWLWLTRYALRMWQRVRLSPFRGGGLNIAAAAYEDREWYGSPEAAADEELTYWTDDEASTC